VSWDMRFMAMATLVSTWSKDPRKRVGAVLVSPDRRHVSVGYNGLPSGFPDDVMLDRETKNRYSLHAETNAIAQAAQDVRGWTLYVTEAPCLQCALSIHRAGISRVVSAALEPGSSWHAEQVEARGFLASMGVEVPPCD
jgi:dCMP deaminase